MSLNWIIVLVVAAVVVIGYLATRSSTKKLILRQRKRTPTPNIKPRTPKTGLNYLVIGGGGFAGSHVAEALIARGEANVRVFDLAPIEQTPFTQLSQVEYIQGNLLDTDALDRACDGVNVVFYTAAMVDYWSRLPFQWDRIYNVNVNGTKNVIAACVKHNVKKLIQTSTTSVIFNEWGNYNGIDETTPYANRPVNFYTQTKILAEKEILAANGRNGLATGSVRPNGLFGPRDNLMAEAVYINGKPAEMLAEINYHDWVYIENLVHGMLLLEQHLAVGSPAAGQAYFIGNGPMQYREFWTKLNRALGGNDKDIVILPSWVTIPLSHISETLTRLSKGSLKGEFFMLTPPVLQIARSTSVFSNEKAKKLLGYEAPYTYDQAFERIREYYHGK